MPRRPQPPTPAQLRDAAADRKDVMGLFREITAAPPGTDRSVEYARLLGLIEEVVADDPSNFIDSILSHTSAMIGLTLFRTSAYLQRRLKDHDNNARRYPAMPVPEDLAQNTLPYFVNLTRSLVEIEQLRANAKPLQASAKPRRVSLRASASKRTATTEVRGDQHATEEATQLPAMLLSRIAGLN